MKRHSRSLAPLAVAGVLLGLAAAPAARAGFAYDATGGAENGGDPINGANGAGPILADRFVSPVSGTLGPVTLNLMLAGPSAGSGLTVDLFADNGAAGPGQATLIASVDEKLLSSAAFSLLTFKPAATISLVAGRSYYIGVFDAKGASNAVLGNTVDPAVLGRASVISGVSYYNNGGVQANSGGPYEIGATANAAVPEPASLALMLGGIASIGLTHRAWRSRGGPNRG